VVQAEDPVVVEAEAVRDLAVVPVMAEVAADREDQVEDPVAAEVEVAKAPAVVPVVVEVVAAKAVPVADKAVQEVVEAAVARWLRLRTLIIQCLI
jgi:hypothetical protein